jgi:hypothetical protein
MGKLWNTLSTLASLFLARSFGEYVHSTGGPNLPPSAVYRWRGALWSIPTGPLTTQQDTPHGK